MEKKNPFENMRTDKIETLFELIGRTFDILEIRVWQNGYTVTVGISRPVNAPSFRVTGKDFERQQRSSACNLILCRMGDGHGLFKRLEFLLEAVYLVSQLDKNGREKAMKDKSVELSNFSNK